MRINRHTAGNVYNGPMKHLSKLAQDLIHQGDQYISQNGAEKFHLGATALLKVANLHEVFNLSELMEYSLKSDFSVEQNYASAQFSDFPITIARGEHCFLDLYFWRRRPTVIHDHHFTGAFQCLHGVNVDLEFEYVPQRKLGLYHDMGEVKLKHKRKILKGEIAPIDLLDKFIHQNHHQDELTINACFRTPDIGKTNLSNYLYSGLRFEKHPMLLDRTHRLMNYLFLGEVPFEKLDLSIDDALNFLIRFGHSQSQSKNYLHLRKTLDERVKRELGLDIQKLLEEHQLKMDELENHYD